MTRNDSVSKSESKSLISDALFARLRENIMTVDGNGLPVKKTGAQAVADGILDMALFSENEKVRGTMSKLILEYTQGKPAVQDTTVKADIPIAAFELISSEKQQIEEAAARVLPEPPEEEPKIVINIDGVSGEV